MSASSSCALEHRWHHHDIKTEQLSQGSRRSQVPVLDDPAAVTALVPASLRPPRVGLFRPHRCSVQPTPKAGERAAADGKNRLHHPPALTCHSTWAPPGSLGLHWGNSWSAPSERGPGPHRDPRQRWRSRVRVSQGSVPGSRRVRTGPRRRCLGAP